MGDDRNRRVAKGLREYGTIHENRAAQGDERIGQLLAAAATPSGPGNAGTAAAGLGSIALVGLAYLIYLSSEFLAVIALSLGAAAFIVLLMAVCIIPVLRLTVTGRCGSDVAEDMSLVRGRLLGRAILPVYVFSATWMIILSSAGMHWDGVRRGASAIPAWMHETGAVLLNGYDRLISSTSLTGQRIADGAHGGVAVSLTLLAIALLPWLWLFLRLKRVSNGLTALWVSLLQLAIVAWCCLWFVHKTVGNA